MKLQTIIASTLLFIGLAHAATLPAEKQCSYLGDCCEGGCDACCSGLECVGIVFPGVSATFLHVQLLCPYWLGHTGLHRISIKHRDVSKYWLASFRGIEVGLDLLREGLFLICPQISGLVVVIILHRPTSTVSRLKFWDRWYTTTNFRRLSVTPLRFSKNGWSMLYLSQVIHTFIPSEVFDVNLSG